jgi:hypothetical protein
MISKKRLTVFIGFLLISGIAISLIDMRFNPNQDQVKQNTSIDNSTLSQGKDIEDLKEKSSEVGVTDIASMFPIACFAPGTDESIIEDYYNTQRALANSLGIDIDSEPSEFNLFNRWGVTATDGGGLQQGDFTTLTWSYVEDGTAIPNSCRSTASGDSNVISFFNDLYGEPTTPGDYTTAPWHQIFVNMFNSWAEVSGLQFVYEPNDDGVAVATLPGEAGVRGDLRISGHSVDGPSNVLACNYYPNNGDMIIDTSDTFFTNNPGSASNPFLGTVNVLTHELGHGLGIAHVCPISQTKLMEPFVSLAFVGQQEDDILAINRAYGDREGGNFSAARAKFLGDNSDLGLFTETQLSIDDNSEVDYFSFTATQLSDVGITLRPTGTIYLDGVQLGNGACSPGEPFNALTVTDLMVEILDQDRETVISTADSNGPGGIEGLVTTLSETGTYYIRVQQQSNVNNVQMYNLEVNFGNCSNPTVPANLLASSITSTSALIGWEEQELALFDIRYRENGTQEWIEINDVAAPNQTLSDLVELTEYEVQIRSRCSGGTPTAYSESFFFTTASVVYCDSEGGSQDDEYIGNVQFGSIDNDSTDENGGYSDFTGISTQVLRGQDYQITITPVWTDSVFEEGYAVWIDFNQNGDFSDDGELVFSQAPTNETPVGDILSIPLTAVEGLTRMRVSMKWDGIPEPCESFDFGEVEDYSVEVLDESIGVTDNVFGADFNLFPNPTDNGQFTISTPNLNGEVIVDIFNLAGQNVSNQALNVVGQRVKVNVDRLSSGVYLVNLSQDNQSFSSKLIVE